MLGFFRRLINSRYGVVLTLGFVAVIALAFAAGDVTGLSGKTGVLGSSLIKVGGEGVSAADIRKQAEQQLRVARRQQPGASMAALVAAGGIDSIVERMTSILALEHFGRDQGMMVSPALVGSELKAIPAFQGPTGQFDQANYERAIAEVGQTDAQVQRDIARETMAQFLIAPTIGAGQVPRAVAARYGALLLERRQGQLALIRAIPNGPAPSDAEITAWYKAHVAAYTIPERRVARYATVSPASVAQRATPSDAELAQAYAAAGATYAAKQVRDVALVTVLDQKGANALAAKIRGGQDVAAAARAVGLVARTVAGVEKAALAQQTSSALADAAFAAAPSGVVGPVKGAIGFVVGKVTKVTNVAAKSLAEARPQLFADLTKKKTADLLGQIQNKVDDALSDNGNINEIAADQKLTPVSTPALLANGVNPDLPAKPDPALAPILSAAFGAEEGDTPTMVPLGQDGSFAIVALDRIVRPTPVPLDRVRARVVQDIQVDRAQRAVRAAAQNVVAQAAKGAPLTAALAAAKVGAQVQPINVTRAQLNANPKGPDPALAALFTLKRGAARAIPAPNGAGWVVVKLDQIVPGDVSKQPVVIDATRADIGKILGQEYVRAFAHAIANQVGVKRDTAGVEQLKKELAGGASAQ